MKINCKYFFTILLFLFIILLCNVCFGVSITYDDCEFFDYNVDLEKTLEFNKEIPFTIPIPKEFRKDKVKTEIKDYLLFEGGSGYGMKFVILISSDMDLSGLTFEDKKLSTFYNNTDHDISFTVRDYVFDVSTNEFHYPDSALNHSYCHYSDGTDYKTITSGSSFTLPYSGMYTHPLSSDFVETTFDIKDNVTGELLFQGPPSVEKTSAEIAGEVVQEKIKEELAELVPVGIVIMATMIVVSLIASFSFFKG